jgi:hypothetical protein
VYRKRSAKQTQRDIWRLRLGRVQATDRGNW